MKKFILLTCVILCISLNSYSTKVHAFEDNNQEIFEYEIEEQTDISKKDIKEAVNEVKKDEREVVSEKSLDKADFNIGKTNSGASYVEYILSDFPITLYEEGKSFKNLLSDNYRIKVPYITTSGERAIILYDVNNQGNMEMTQQTIIGDSDSLYVEPDKIDAIINSQINEKVKEVTYCYSDRYSMTIVYIQTAENEYLIPFAEEKTLNVKNGEVYSVSSFFTKLNKIIDESKSIGSEENGGFAYRETNLTKYALILLVMFIGFVLTGIKLYKINKN